MADCKACGAWFGTTTPQDLCPACERALARLNGYAAPVVRCRDCKHGDRVYEDRDDYGCRMMLALPRWFKGDHFCAYGERKDGGG